MNVDTIELYSNDHKVFGFSFSEHDASSPFIIKGATGLDAEDIIPRFYGSGLESAEKYYDLTLQPREIVLRIGLNPNWNTDNRPSDLRDVLYKAIASARHGQVQVKFLDDASVVGVISGYVTKFEASHFSKSTDVQMTIYCPDPLIRSEYLSSIDITGLDLENLILIDPVSTAPHGFQFVATVVDFTEAEQTFYIRESEADYNWFFGYYLGTTFSEGTELHFSSEVNDRLLWAGPGFPTDYLMGAVFQGSTWPLMFPGTNTYFVEWLGIDFEWTSISYHETHWGI